MSGLKTEIIENTTLGQDSLCLDQYEDGSVRLICNEDYEGLEENSPVCKFKRTAHIHLSKKEMMKLISTYLKYENLEDEY